MNVGVADKGRTDSGRDPARLPSMGHCLEWFTLARRRANHGRAIVVADDQVLAPEMPDLSANGWLQTQASAW
ncbi:hypothetical protein X738_28030 [Mesorhizobium sp. LNHC209A00]|nr:hypothetical protein X738_28030 [Mesorhizobium sp. LNHC209A00]